MTYETLVYVCQLVAMVIFGAVMLGIIVYVLRPANKAKFEAASRLALRHDDGTAETPNGKQ